MEGIGEVWGLVIFIQLMIVLLLKVLRIIKEWGRPVPASLMEILYVIDQLGLTDKKAIEKVKQLIDLNSNELKSFIVEENRRAEKRKFDERLKNRRENEEG